MSDKFLLRLFLGIVIGFIIFVSVFKKDEPKREYIPDSMDAYIMAKKFVTKTLKAPSTAEFAAESQSTIKSLGDHTYEVNSYVDAQNSFGAMIRTNFVAKVRYAGNEQWTLDDLKTN